MNAQLLPSGGFAARLDPELRRASSSAAASGCQGCVRCISDAPAVDETNFSNFARRGMVYFRGILIGTVQRAAAYVIRTYYAGGREKPSRISS